MKFFKKPDNTGWLRVKVYWLVMLISFVIFVPGWVCVLHIISAVMQSYVISLGLREHVQNKLNTIFDYSYDLDVVACAMNKDKTKVASIITKKHFECERNQSIAKYFYIL